jgi:hypothetical protein
MTLKGYADPDVGRAYARVLCQQVEDTPVLWGLWLYDFARGALRSGTAVGGVIRLPTVTGGRGHIGTSRQYRRMLSLWLLYATATRDPRSDER